MCFEKKNFIFIDNLINCMAIYEQKWWKKLFSKPVRQKRVDIDNDIEAISECLNDLSDDQKFLIESLERLNDLEKEFHVAKSGIVQVNLETQAVLLEKIMERFDFLHNDIAINNLRLKKISQELLKRADKAGLKDLVREKKRSIIWK